MANLFTISPYVLDTAGATDLAVPVAGARLKIAKLRWDNSAAAAAADAIIVTDSAGNVLWTFTFVAGNLAVSVQESDFYPPLDVAGLKLPTMTRGKLYVYIVPGG
jgi:hypothetical protein